MAPQHPANQARNTQKTATPKKKTGHTPSTKTPSPTKNAKPSTQNTYRADNANPHNWPIVEIHWIDAVADGLHEWLTPEDLHNIKPVNSLTVGYLLQETPQHTTIASLINEDNIAHTLTIPNTIIINKKTLT